MKRRDLIRKIAKEAKRQGVSWIEGEGGKHSTYMLGSHTIPVPRHTEIGEGLAEQIFKECESELGRRWWK